MERPLEMVEAKVAFPFVVLLALSSCSSGGSFTWVRHPMDGHRTGVTAPTADNVAEALGVIDDSVYIAPNGVRFASSSATYAVAADMIAVQPEMAALKQVIGHSSAEMLRGGANCALSNWIVDHMREDVARLTGKRVDVAILNSGGIRVDLPEGDVLMDDLVSMLPFKNYLSYVALEGRDLVALFEQMAEGSMQPVSGVHVVLDGHRLDTLLVGGKPVDPDRVYGVGTIDFLLDGGDRLNVAKNAKELIITDCLLIDSMLPYAMSYAQQGRPIEYFTDDRVVIKGRADK